jgi:hypothetical protein
MDNATFTGRAVALVLVLFIIAAALLAYTVQLIGQLVQTGLAGILG